MILDSFRVEWFTWGRMIYLAAPPNIIDLSDDDEDVAPKPRKSKKVAAGRWLGKNQLQRLPFVKLKTRVGPL